jgi:hypothetical protein
VQFPLCGIYTFDDEDRLAGEKIYYDRATVLRQLGVFHEPDRSRAASQPCSRTRSRSRASSGEGFCGDSPQRARIGAVQSANAQQFGAIRYRARHATFAILIPPGMSALP